jgi:hypothetical protein
MMLLFSDDLTHYHKTCQYINSCLDLIQYALCFRCASEQGIRPNSKRHHHCGRILTHLLGEPTEKQVEMWSEDTEHGLFHGLSTAIMASLVIRSDFDTIRNVMSLGGECLLVKEKNLSTRKVSIDIENIINPRNYSDYHSIHCDEPLSFEQLAASCVLHDFIRCSGVSEFHDVQLREVFPFLMEKTYSHASPLDHNHPLVIGDVLELKRYPDHLQWYNPEVVETKLDPEQKQIVQCYYRTIRPALEYAFANKSDLWIAHGPEVPNDMSKNSFPQHPHDWAAIEVDRLPFQHCFIHDKNIHSAPWAFLRGAIPLQDFKKKGGKVRPHMEFYRDHYYANCDLRFDDWIFVTNNDAKCRRPWLTSMAKHLIDSGCKVVDISIINKFIYLAGVFYDRIILTQKDL